MVFFCKCQGLLCCKVFYFATHHYWPSVVAFTHLLNGMLDFCGKIFFFVGTFFGTVFECDFWELAVPLQLRFILCMFESHLSYVDDFCHLVRHCLDHKKCNSTSKC